MLSGKGDGHGARVVVRAVGMASPLGLDAETACAAARAGLSRATRLAHFKLKGPDSDVLGVTGHCVPMVTHGFEGSARLMRVAQAALEDLRRDMGDTMPSELAFYVGVPDPMRRFGGIPLLPDASLKADYEQQLAGLLAIQAETQTVIHTPRSLALDVLSRAAYAAGWKHPFEVRGIDASGHTSVAVALSAAVNDLRQCKVRTAIVGGFDSFIEQRTLQWLNDLGRLKTPVVAAGLQPGEAAAFMMLELADDGGATGPVRGRIEGIQFARESHPLLNGEPPMGDGLAQVMLATAIASAWDRNARPWIISDHNGELYRAYDWGHACVRLRPAYAQLAEAGPWYPCEAFGDTGAASGAIGLIMAMAAFQRAYAPARSAMVLSASDGPGRAAVQLGSP